MKFSSGYQVTLWMIALTITWMVLEQNSVWAEEATVEPYIEKIKNQMQKKGQPSSDATSGSYTESLRLKLAPEKEGDKSYIDQLKAADPLRLNPSTSPEGSYSESEKNKLEPQEEGGAIQAFKEGRSELKPKKKGIPRQAIGLKYGDGGLLSRNYALRSGSVDADFNEIYSSGYTPEVSVLYEYRTFQSETFGSIGLFAQGGVGYFHTLAKLSNTLTNPAGGSFDTQTDVKLKFFMFPITLGLNYRLNLFRWVRPYASFGVSIIPYGELRSDNNSINKGNSRGYMYNLGVGIPMDWLSSGDSWSLYQNYGFLRLLLTVEYMKLTTPSGKIDFSEHGYLIGLTLEY